jgi:predicted transcriptional regulator
VLAIVRAYLEEEEETLTPEEEAEVEEGLAQLARGESIDLDELIRELRK